MNFADRWDLQVDRAVDKDLKKFPRHDVEGILEVIRLLPGNPFFGDIQKMHGTNHVWRRRIGAYRLFYKLDASEKTILVFRIDRRTSNTY